MSPEQKKPAPASVAPKATPDTATAKSPAVSAPATQAAVRAVRPRARTVDKVAAQHQKVLAEALTKAAPATAAKAAKATKPASVTAQKPVMAKPAKPVKPEKVAKPAKPEKPAKAPKPIKAEKAAKPAKVRKTKLVRDSYAMPEVEYARIADLKKRLVAQNFDVKKSELLRAGILVLVALSDSELKAVMARVERIKTGRPAKK